jgi:hypothetical protein
MASPVSAVSLRKFLRLLGIYLNLIWQSNLALILDNSKIDNVRWSKSKAKIVELCIYLNSNPK